MHGSIFMKIVIFMIVIINSSPGCISVQLESKVCPAVRLLAEEQQVQW
jgi:hypothetical protein